MSHLGVTINLTKAEIAYNSSGSDLMTTKYTVTNFYNNNLFLIVYQ